MSKERSKHAETIISNHVMWSMGAGLLPVAIIDIFAVSAVQIDMIRQLCKVYEIPFEETQGKALVTSLTGTALARAGAASAIKLIPGLGTVLGGVAQSVFCGASTYALGEVFKKHFETGGTFLDFDPDRLRKYYKEKFEKGKKVAREMKDRQEREQKAAAATKAKNQEKNETFVPFEEAEPVSDSLDNGEKDTSMLAKLKELAALKKEGILTEEEFNQMKKRIIGNI